MIRLPPRSTRADTLFPSRRASERRRRNPILLLIATPWHVSKAMMARAGAQETENAPSAVRPDKRLIRCTGGKTCCRPFNIYFFPPQRLLVDSFRRTEKGHVGKRLCRTFRSTGSPYYSKQKTKKQNI